MDQATERAVERAISTMRDNLGDELTVADLARAAMFSKFHFSRIFQRVTGLSPGRFLSAMRLERAKQLLVSTSLNVADISVLVGYNSVGTFSSRFTRSVGLSPTVYRRMRGYRSDIPTAEGRYGGEERQATVHGVIRAEQPDRSGLVFVGLFPDRIPEGRPQCCAILPGPGPYRFEQVPQGRWYLLAQSVATDTEEQLTRDTFAGGEALSVGTEGPITIGRDTAEQVADLWLKPVRSVDPPVLLALLDARKLALARYAERRQQLANVSLVGQRSHQSPPADADRPAA
jgi:AraC family transcriptional regulator